MIRSAVALPPLAAMLTLATALAACGDDGKATPTPSPTATASPGVAITAVITPLITPAACDGSLADEPPDLTVYGADADDFLADRFSLASGDFNGDGLADLLIGAPKADGPDDARGSAGEAYVILGREVPPSTIDLAQEGADFTFLGEAAGDNFGFTVAAGDVDGDGTDDIIVGARFASHEGRRSVGKTYVVYGRPELPQTIDSARGGQDLTIIGRDAGDFSGIALATGDVDGDGADDLLIGASSAAGPDNSRPHSGEVYVVRGGADLPALIDLGGEEPLFTVFGAEELDLLPNAIASGDFDGDGRGELLLGAPFASGGDATRPEAGEAYIVAVPPGGGSLDLAAGQGFRRITGAVTRDALGFFVAVADVNGDGLDDAVVGARNADARDDGRNNAGEVHVLFGGSGLPAALDLAASPAHVTLYGGGLADSLGFTVATADTDGDGIADILAGAPLSDGCSDSQEDAGEVYVIRGGPDLEGELDMAAGGFAAVLYGIEAGDVLGFSLTGGDFNGDGKDDILAGALLADGPEGDRADAGEAYVILSR